MKLIYKENFNGDETLLPHKEHMPGAVQFKEMEMKIFTIVINIIATFIMLILLFVYFQLSDFDFNSILIGCILSLICLFPHEFLHAICFKETVYLYTYLQKGALFVVGNENMTKTRFIIMSMLPNLIFGFIPFTLFMIFPQYSILGALGALSIGMGAGDYYNVFNALTQMPKGALTYLNGFHSYWFIP